jgi:hypothetical protein
MENGKSGAVYCTRQEPETAGVFVIPVLTFIRVNSSGNPGRSEPTGFLLAFTPGLHQASSDFRDLAIS